MKQKYLFGEPEPAAVTKSWGRFNDGLGTCGAIWRNHAIDYDVEHCGHPTAQFPYLVRRRSDGQAIIAPNGLAFQYLTHAKSAAERLADDSIQVIQLERGAYAASVPTAEGLTDFERIKQSWEVIAPGYWN